MSQKHWQKAIAGLKSKLEELRQKVQIPVSRPQPLTPEPPEQIALAKHQLDGVRSPKDKETMVIEISALTVVKVTTVIIIALLLLQFLASVVDIIILLFGAAILAAAIMPVVDFFQARRIPRAITTLVIYVLVLALLAMVTYSFIPFFAEQLGSIANYLNNLVQYLSTTAVRDWPFGDRLEPLLAQIDQQQLVMELQRLLQSFSGQLRDLAAGAFNVATGIFGGLFVTLTILVLAFYMVLEKTALAGFFRSILPHQHEDYIVRHVVKIQAKMGAWVRGQLALSLIIGLLTYIGLKILGVQYAGALGILAGIFEIIPYIGPIAAGLLAATVAFIQSPALALFVLILAWVIQVLENNIVVPLVMQRAVGLNPIIVIVALLIGGKLMGALGMILSVPVATALSVFISDYLGRSR